MDKPKFQYLISVEDDVNTSIFDIILTNNNNDVIYVKPDTIRIYPEWSQPYILDSLSAENIRISRYIITLPNNDLIFTDIDSNFFVIKWNSEKEKYNNNYSTFFKLKTGFFISNLLYHPDNIIVFCASGSLCYLKLNEEYSAISIHKVNLPNIVGKLIDIDKSGNFYYAEMNRDIFVMEGITSENPNVINMHQKLPLYHTRSIKLFEDIVVTLYGKSSYIESLIRISNNFDEEDNENDYILPTRCISTDDCRGNIATMCRYQNDKILLFDYIEHSVWELNLGHQIKSAIDC